MKRLLSAGLILLFMLSAFFAAPMSARASEGDGGHGMEVEVNGHHVTLESQNEWAKGENLLTVTITDSMGMPLSGADVEILIAPKDDEHGSSEADSHDSGQEEAMPGMDMGSDQPQEPQPGVMQPGVMQPNEQNASDHDEESVRPIAMTETEHGTYTVQTHLETSGEYEVHVYFHVNGEMMQADFAVNVKGSNSKYFVLGSFAAVNIAIVAAAGALKKQKSLLVKGGK